MFLALSLGLLPLGLIAILASIQSVQDGHDRRSEETSARVTMKAQRLDAALARSAIEIRAASAAIAEAPPESSVCEDTLRRLVQGEDPPGRYALFDETGAVRCATPGFHPPLPLAKAANGNADFEIIPDGEALRFTLYRDNRTPEGIGEFSRRTVADLTFLADAKGEFDLELRQNAQRMALRDDFRDGPLVQNVSATAPVADGRLQLAIALSNKAMTPAEILMLMLPVLMWVFAALIGWLIVDRLILKPLGRLHNAVAAYQPGDSGLDIPASATPSREIRQLGRAFDKVTKTVAQHEQDLEAAIARQTKLVREVHHRVKNNLQVVASLLNLHSRGSTNEDVAAAYASIQRRVDALAVVHRNHYAELEESQGVALKSLISELGANLRATAPSIATRMAINLDIEPFYATQDVAVSIAFLLTEIVELAMYCGADPVTIALRKASPNKALLSIESASLKAGAPCDDNRFERFDRIVTGLARQLRSTIDRDTEAGRYAIEIAVTGRSDG